MGPPRLHPETAGFDLAAAAYERGRPGYPPAAVDWLADRLAIGPGSTVADVAAGTGKLTRSLAGRAGRLLAVEPVAGMAAVLRAGLPQVPVIAALVEALPLRPAALDAVTVAQAFHWFDGPAALAELHRVLRPGGRLGLVWNRRDLDDPLQAGIGEIVAPHRGTTPAHASGRWRAAFDQTDRFDLIGCEVVAFEQPVDVAALLDRVLSTSFIAALDADGRQAVADQTRALAARIGTPLVLRYRTELFGYEAR